jgi:ubiquinone/menaquinone biosynthesis C-methylase UbiE
MVHLTGTYTDVDRSPDPVAAAEWMDTMCDWPFIRAYKERTVDLLQVKPGARLLDVGCGTGHDTRALAVTAGPEGIAIGVDASAVMLKTARTRGGSYLQADARALPYEDGAFDGTRIDRVLQHVPGPEDAVHEIARVTRAGGRVVAIDPDQETLVADVSDPGLLRKVKDFRRDRNLCNGTIGRQADARRRAARRRRDRPLGGRYRRLRRRRRVPVRRHVLHHQRLEALTRLVGSDA